ncbi:MAG: iron-containing alcohol dehydrogenase [Clostridiales Family XIII bacterium]|jgi:alcohol dehydrogenase YqhD (iron-dependent ADH family)|nr:iron-containing alcohol dehydrogenase [Clostridiales Family XIII bacterium]
MKKITGFSFHMYTEILFGKGVELRVGEFVRKYGGSKVMLVYGGGSIKRNGLYERVTEALKAEGIDIVEFGGVSPNPRRSFVDQGLKLAQAEKVDFLLGVGGGSSIDTAKAIALGLANNGEYWKFYNGVEALKMAPLGVIHTIAAAGSETSCSSVLVDDGATGLKKGFMWTACRPLFAIMNPELTYSLPPYQTACGAADIFAHTFMRYFTESDSYLGDEYCEGTLRTVVKYAPIAVNNANDYEARAELMLAGSFSHNDLTSIGRSPAGRGGEHPLEAQLSGHYDTAHGAGLSVVMPAMLSYAIKHGTPKQAARVAQFGVKVFGVTPDMNDVIGVAESGVRGFRAWLRSIGMPLTLRELGVPEGDLEDVVRRCMEDNGGLIEGFLNMDETVVREIYSSILK